MGVLTNFATYLCHETDIYKEIPDIQSAVKFVCLFIINKHIAELVKC